MASNNENEEFRVQRVNNILLNGNKFQKKQTLKELAIFFSDCHLEELISVFRKVINALSLAFQDPAEMCREAALNSCIEALGRLPPEVDFLSSLIPAIHNRLCSDQVEETSEELKLLYIELTSLLVEKHKEMVVPFVDELVEILCQGVADSAPQVKKKSCFCIGLLSIIPSLKYQSHLNKLIKPLAGAIRHQHWRVRVSVIEAIDITILNGDPKILPDALAPLTTRFFDDNSHVRLALTKLIGNWMLNHYDRYSYFSQMIPMILTSLSDQDEKVRTEAHTLWDAVGEQYSRENEKDLKDKIDWIEGTLGHYPKGVSRPNLGCRTLIEREVGKFALAIGKELGDWTENVRIKSAQLLCQVVLHAESNITQDLHKIIAPMARAARDDGTPAVVHHVMLAAEYLGYFVPSKVYFPLILEHIQEANYGELRIVSSLVKGSKPDDLRPFLNKLSHLLDQTTFKVEEHIERMNLISSILSVCGPDSLDIGDLIFQVLVCAAAHSSSEEMANRAKDLLSRFSELGGGDRRIVFNTYCKSVLTALLVDNWTVNCDQQFIFTAVVCYTSEIIEENIETIIEMCKKSLCNPDTDPECILNIIIALNKIFDEKETILPTHEVCERFKDALLNEVLTSLLKWKPGRSAEAVRSMAATTLCHLLPPSASHPHRLPPHLLPVILSLAEDPSGQTRQLALEAIIRCSPLPSLHESGAFPKILTAVLKRLDDCDEKVREMCVGCVVALYNEETKIQDADHHLNESLLDFVYATMLIHLDDQDTNLQKIVLDGLKSTSSLNPELLLRKIRVDNFRDKDIASELVKFIEEELTKRSKIQSS